MKRIQPVIVRDPPKSMRVPASVSSTAAKVTRPLPEGSSNIKFFLIDSLIWVVTILHLAWLLLYLLLNLDNAHTVPLSLLTQKIEPALSATILSKRAKLMPAAVTTDAIRSPGLVALEWIETQNLNLEKRNEADKQFGARRVPNQILNNQVSWLLNPQTVVPTNLTLETIYQTLVYVNNIKHHLPTETQLILRVPLGYQLFILLVQIPLLLFLRSHSPLIEREAEEEEQRSTRPKCTTSTKKTILLIVISLILLVHFVFLAITIAVNLATPTLAAAESVATTTIPAETEPLRTPFSTDSSKLPLTSSSGNIMATPTTVSKSITVHPLLDIAVRETRLNVNLSIFMVDLRRHLLLLRDDKRPMFSLPRLPSKMSTEIDALLTEWSTMNLRDPQNALASLALLTTIHRLHSAELNAVSSQMIAALSRPSALVLPTELQDLWLNSSLLWNLPITLREQFAAWIREAKAAVMDTAATTSKVLSSSSSSSTTVTEINMLNYSFLFSNVIIFALLQILCWTIYLYFIVSAFVRGC